MRTLRLAPLCALAALALSLSARAEDAASTTGTATEAAAEEPAGYHSRSLGYTIELPDGWQPIPDDVMSEFRKNTAASLPAGISFDAGFSGPGGDNWFSMPYVIVQVSRYRQMGMQAAPSEESIPKFVKLYTSDGPKKASKTSRTGEPTIDVASHSFRYEIRVARDEGPAVVSTCLGTFGRDALLSVNFYEAEGSGEANTAAREAFFSSFRFDEAKAYDPKAAKALDARRKNISYRLGQFAGMALIAAFVIAIVKRATSKKDED